MIGLVLIIFGVVILVGVIIYAAKSATANVALGDILVMIAILLLALGLIFFHHS